MQDQLTYRTLRLRSASATKEARTVDASLSSEEPVLVYGDQEQLIHTPEAIDLTRAAEGLPLLFDHDRQQPVGVVENVRIESGRLVGTLRFGNSAKAAEVFADVLDNILRGISIGYRRIVSEYVDGVLVTSRWELIEASILAIPADVTVGVGRGAPAVITNGSPQNMDKTTAADPADIIDLCMRHGMPGMAAGLVRRGVSTEAARAEVLDELSRRSGIGAGGHLNVNPASHQLAAVPQTVEAMAEALAERAGGPSAPRENQYRNVRVQEMARDLLELRGVRTTAMAPGVIIERALHTTSDFPDLLTSTANRIMRLAYSGAPSIKDVFKSSTAKDFRAKSKIQLSDGPELLKVNEHGEFKYGTMAVAKSSYALGTYGRIFGLSRQALVNDDLDAFGGLLQRLGRAAAEFESKFLVDLLTSNPVLDEDGVATFHASHGNLGTTAASALQFTSLVTARKAMRLQKGLGGNTPINATPAYLIVPAALEQVGEQLISQIQATTWQDTNPFAGKLKLVVDPRLDAVSSTRWYLAADAGVIDTIEYSYLESAAGPEVISEAGFEVDGMKMKVRLDFGAGVLDFRGLYRGDGV